jgi:hypothetical protein
MSRYNRYGKISRGKLLVALTFLFTLAYVASRFVFVSYVKTPSGIFPVERTSLRQFSTSERQVLTTGSYEANPEMLLDSVKLVASSRNSNLIKVYSPLLYIEYLLWGSHKNYFHKPKPVEIIL